MKRSNIRQKSRAKYTYGKQKSHDRESLLNYDKPEYSESDPSIKSSGSRRFGFKSSDITRPWLSGKYYINSSFKALKNVAKESHWLTKREANNVKFNTLPEHAYPSTSSSHRLGPSSSSMPDRLSSEMPNLVYRESAHSYSSDEENVSNTKHMSRTRISKNSKSLVHLKREPLRELTNSKEKPFQSKTTAFHRKQSSIEDIELDENSLTDPVYKLFLLNLENGKH